MRCACLRDGRDDGAANADGERAIRDVFVDGEQAVKDGKLVNIDFPSALQAVEDVQRKGSLTISERDWAKRDIDALAPIALPIVGLNDFN